MTTKMSKTKNTSLLSAKSIATATLVAVLSFSSYRLIQNGEPLYYLLPNFLIFTPLNHLAPKIYRDPADVLPLERDHIKIQEIAAADYSYEYMREVTEDFSKPVLIKGLFSNTTAGMYWDKPGYLKSKLGDLKVPVYGTLTNSSGGLHHKKDDVALLSSGDVTEEIMVTKNSNHRFIFPQLAIAETDASDPATMYAKAEELMEDVELERLRKGWGKKGHFNYIGQQIFIGCGLTHKNAYEGITWHTEPGNNWFIQITGMKRWYLVAPKDSSLMLPKKKTGRLMITSDIPYMTKLHDRLPIMYADVGAGDVIFNPEWYWHKTKIYPGPSISISMREFYTFRNFRSSPHYFLQFVLRLPFEMQTATFIKKFMKKMFFAANMTN